MKTLLQMHERSRNCKSKQIVRNEKNWKLQVASCWKCIAMAIVVTFTAFGYEQQKTFMNNVSFDDL
jgi:hypothetical protein